MDLIELYCSVDDFWKSFKNEWDRHLIDAGGSKSGPDPQVINSLNDDDRGSLSPV